MRLRASVFVAAFAATLVVGSASGQVAVLGDINASGDADHFDTLRLRTGALLRYESPFQYSGLAAQTTRYEQFGWHRDAQAVMVLWRNQHRDTLAGTIGEAGLTHIGGRTRVIGDATWSLRPGAHTGIELLAAGDLVETQRALDRATAYTLFGISAEQQVSQRLTVTGLAGYQHFTDGNARVHLRGRVIWLLVPEHGITAQVRWRQYQSNQIDVDGAYFNPGRYRELQAAVAIRKRYAGWLWSGTLAAGRERIHGNIEHPTTLAELRAEGTIGKGIRLALHASYNRSAGFAVADRYWYRVIGATVIVPF
jgi:hypothetical protein